MKNILFPTKLSSLWLLLAAFVLVSACKDEEDGPPPRPEESIVDIINETEGLDSLSIFLDSFQGLQNRLSSGEYTVFAPNNAAFQKLLQNIGLESMSQLNPNLLSEIVLYHVVANDILNANELDSAATTLSVEQINFTQGDSVLINNESQTSQTVIISPNLQASNGVVHVINEVLLPSSMRAIEPYFGKVLGLTSTFYFGGQFGGLSTITNVFAQANLLETLNGAGPFTILAPLDATFNSFFSNSLNAGQLANYHILEGNINLAEADRVLTTKAGEPVYVSKVGENTYLNGTFAGDFNLNSSNGKVILLAGVLKPAEELDDIITNAEVLTGETFTVFRTALRQTNLQLGDNRTIFIPTDEAFEEAGLITSIDSIDSAEVARLDPALLTDLLQTHIINGVNFSSDVVAAETITAKALNNTSLTIELSSSGNGSTVLVSSPNTEDGQVILFDELSNHGVVHVISKVLQP